MDKLKNYIPMLVTKQGEFKAIHHLDSNALSRLTPLFDVHRLSIASGKRKTLDEHIDKIVNNFEKYCIDIMFLLDCSKIELSSRMKDGQHPFGYLCRALSEKGMKFIPVFGLDRDREYILAIKEYLFAAPYSSVCLRLLPEDMDGIGNLKAEINDALSLLGLDSQRCDLIVDFKSIEASQIDSIIDSLSQLNLVFPLANWRSFILAASSFPEDMSGIKRDTHESIRRVENDLWKTAILAEPLIGRKPRFGDYCVNNPSKPEVDVATMRAVAKIRYTTKETWEVFRGHGLQSQKGDKFSQYFNLAQQLTEADCYMGAGYSWGDERVAQCAAERKKTGNLLTWVQVDTNHHLTLIGEYIASFGEF